MDRRRNFVVYTERTDALDNLFRTRATKVQYDEDKYILQFKNPIAVSTLKKWSGCENVEGVMKREIKHKTTEEIICDSVLEAQKQYEDLVEKGRMVHYILKHFGIREDVLQNPNKKALKLYRKKMEEDLKNGIANTVVAEQATHTTVQVNPAIPEDFCAYPPVMNCGNKTYACL